jgi:hypothetical protein
VDFTTTINTTISTDLAAHRRCSLCARWAGHARRDWAPFVAERRTNDAYQ